MSTDETNTQARARSYNAPRPELTWELLDVVLDRIASGESMRKICDHDPEMPTRKTLFQFIAGNDDVRKRYELAIQMRADALADEILDIADDGINDTYMTEDGKERTDQDVIARSRLRVDARKWMAGKMNPKKYGDKVSTELTGADGAPVNIGLNVVFKSPPKREAGV